MCLAIFYKCPLCSPGTSIRKSQHVRRCQYKPKGYLDLCPRGYVKETVTVYCKNHRYGNADRWGKNFLINFKMLQGSQLQGYPTPGAPGFIGPVGPLAGSVPPQLAGFGPPSMPTTTAVDPMTGASYPTLSAPSGMDFLMNPRRWRGVLTFRQH